MTFVSAFATEQRGLMVSDTAWIDAKSGVVERFADKHFCGIGFCAAYSSRNPGALRSIDFLKSEVREASDLDAFVLAIPSLLERMKENERQRCEEIGREFVSPGTIYCVGWSPQKKRVQVWSSEKDGIPLRVAFASTAEQACKQLGFGGLYVSPRDYCCNLAMRSRQIPTRFAGRKVKSIGGSLRMTTVSGGRLQTAQVHAWPDRIGATIEDF